MSTGSFFGDPWDDDPSQPPSFFGGPLRDAMRWQSAGWGNPLLSLAGQPSFPGSLVPPGATFANLSGPMTQLAANVGAQPDNGGSQTLDPAPMPPPPYGPVPDEIKAQIGHETEEGLKRASEAGSVIGPVMGKIPGLDLLGHGVDIISGILDDSVTRAWIANHIRDWIVNGIQSDLNQVNSAAGQQQMFLNGGSIMPHR